MKYSMGDVTRLNINLEATLEPTGATITIPKGTPGIVMADREHPTLLFPNGVCIGLPEGDEVGDTFNVPRIAQWIANALNDRLDFFSALSEILGMSEEDCMEAVETNITDTLHQIGFKDSDVADGSQRQVKT